MHQPMSALPLIATAKADMYPANGQSAFPPGWLLMSALSARGGGFGIFDQKIFVRYLQVCVEPMGPVHPPPEGGPWGEGHPCSAPARPRAKARGVFVDANAARHVAFGG